MILHEFGFCCCLKSFSHSYGIICDLGPLEDNRLGEYHRRPTALQFQASSEPALGWIHSSALCSLSVAVVW